MVGTKNNYAGYDEVLQEDKGMMMLVYAMLYEAS